MWLQRQDDENFNRLVHIRLTHGLACVLLFQNKRCTHATGEGIRLWTYYKKLEGFLVSCTQKSFDSRS